MGQIIELLWSCVLETDFSKAGGNEQSMVLIIGLEVGKRMGKSEGRQVCTVEGNIPLEEEGARPTLFP